MECNIKPNIIHHKTIALKSDFSNMEEPPPPLCWVSKIFKFFQNPPKKYFGRTSEYFNGENFLMYDLHTSGTKYWISKTKMSKMDPILHQCGFSKWDIVRA